MNGTPHIPALYACQPGLDILNKVGIAAIREKSIRMTTRLIEGAKRHYVKVKRWQPKAGRWMDWALQRRSAKRREAIRKTERGQPELPGSGLGN